MAPSKRKAASAHVSAPTPTTESSAQVTQDLFHVALINIRDEIRGLTSGNVDPGKYTVPDRVAYLAKQASSFAAELRKAEAAERKRVEDITAADVLAFLRAMKPRDRANLLAEVAAIEAGGSGLA